MSSASQGLRQRGNPELLSIVIPCCDEEAAIPALQSRLEAFRSSLGIPVEIILVDDGSLDRTLELLLEWARQDLRVRVVGLARNFGHQVAVTAGLDCARGDAAVIMDADLQDPPEVIVDMLAAYRRGFDVVYGQRTDREGETWFKKFTAWIFYRLMRLFIHRQLPADAGDFRLISLACLRALREMRETHRFLRGMAAWTGLPQIAVPYRRAARIGGRTKYSLSRMLRLAWTAAMGFSPTPLRISFLVGLLMTTVGMAYGFYAVSRTILGLYVVPGWTSVIVLLCLIGGSIQMSLGILGEYVARIYEETKARPLYIVSVSANLGDPKELPQVRR
jgi:glycosyltransferase involved in cell wall biosynthesis